MVELRFLGYLGETAGGRTRQCAVETPKRLWELLPPEFPEANIIILVNNRPGNLDSLIQDGDFAVIMPILSGG